MRQECMLFRRPEDHIAKGDCYDADYSGLAQGL